jgi:hypothetical protein
MSIFGPAIVLHKKALQCVFQEISYLNDLEAMCNRTERISKLRAKDKQNHNHHHCHQHHNEDILNKGLTALPRPNQLPSHTVPPPATCPKGKFGSESYASLGCSLSLLVTLAGIVPAPSAFCKPFTHLSYP